MREKRVVRRALNLVRKVIGTDAESHQPGHFYSVIPSAADILRAQSAAAANPTALAGIDLNRAEQIELLRGFNATREEEPFWSARKKIRFDIENNSFSYDDAPVLHYVMRHLKPRRVIEVGSGHSSGAMLDTDDLYLGKSVDFTFIDPYPARLKHNLLDEDIFRVKIIEQEVQQVDLRIFDQLRENDLLFIDSSHVMKAGSDLQTIFFDVLPRLRPGVWVHFHDVRYPFQYLPEASNLKTFWNEAYVLRAFLMFNSEFKVAFWLNYLLNVNTAEISDLLSVLPLQEAARRFGSESSTAGGSIYLRRAPV